jgi:hypothetical protein
VRCFFEPLKGTYKTNYRTKQMLSRESLLGEVVVNKDSAEVRYGTGKPPTAGAEGNIEDALSVWRRERSLQSSRASSVVAHGDSEPDHLLQKRHDRPVRRSVRGLLDNGRVRRVRVGTHSSERN